MTTTTTQAQRFEWPRNAILRETDVQVFVKLSLLSSRVTSMRSSYPLALLAIQITSSLLISFLMDDYFLFDFVPSLLPLPFTHYREDQFPAKRSFRNSLKRTNILSLSIFFAFSFSCKFLVWISLKIVRKIVRLSKINNNNNDDNDKKI